MSKHSDVLSPTPRIRISDRRSFLFSWRLSTINSSHMNWGAPSPVCILGSRLRRSIPRSHQTRCPRAETGRREACPQGSVHSQNTPSVFRPALKALYSQEKQAFESWKGQHLTPGLFCLDSPWQREAKHCGGHTQ